MMKNKKSLNAPGENKLTPGINNISSFFTRESRFTRSEKTGKSIQVENLWGENPGVSSTSSEVSKNKPQPGRRITCYFNKSITQKSERYVNVNTGEPAAGFVLPIQLTVVEEIQPGSTAAGSLFFATDLHKTNT